jgi:acyl-CoA thioesterase-1
MAQSQLFRSIRARFTLVFAFCSGLAAISSLAEDSEPTSPGGQAAPYEILFLGDSLTAGYGLTPEEAYPALLGEKLRADGFAVEIRNAGLSGDTTAGGARRVGWVLRAPADLVVVALGGNDVLRGFPVEATEKNLRAIIAEVKKRAPEADILLAGMLAPPNMGQAYAEEFSAVYERIAESEDVTFVPFLLEGVAGDPALNQEDGIHPNAKGQQKVASHLLPVIEGLIPPPPE